MLSNETIAIIMAAVVTIATYWIKSQADRKAAEAAVALAAAKSTTEVAQVSSQVAVVQKNADGLMTAMLEEIKELRRQIADRSARDIQLASEVIQKASIVGIAPVPLPVQAAVAPAPMPVAAPPVALPRAEPEPDGTNVKHAAIAAIRGIEGVTQAVEEVPQKTVDLIDERGDQRSKGV